jgi:hypothetical protein
VASSYSRYVIPAGKGMNKCGLYLYIFIILSWKFLVFTGDSQLDEAIRWGFLKLDEDMTLG